MLRSAFQEGPRGTVAEHKGRLAQQVGARVPGYGKRVDIAGRRAGHGEARLHGRLRESRPMLHAAEPLFFDRRDQHAVADEHGGNVSVIRVDAENDHIQRCTKEGCDAWPSVQE